MLNYKTGTVIVIVRYRIHSLKSSRCKTVHMVELNCMRTAVATGQHEPRLVLNSTQQRDKGLSETLDPENGT